MGQAQLTSQSCERVSEPLSQRPPVGGDLAPQSPEPGWAAQGVAWAPRLTPLARRGASLAGGRQPPHGPRQGVAVTCGKPLWTEGLGCGIGKQCAAGSYAGAGCPGPWCEDAALPSGPPRGAGPAGGSGTVTIGAAAERTRLPFMAMRFAAVAKAGQNHCPPRHVQGTVLLGVVPVGCCGRSCRPRQAPRPGSGVPPSVLRQREGRAHPHTATELWGQLGTPRVAAGWAGLVAGLWPPLDRSGLLGPLRGSEEHGSTCCSEVTYIGTC